MTKEQMLARLNSLNAKKADLQNKGLALIPKDDSVVQSDEDKAKFIALMKEKQGLNEEICELQNFVNSYVDPEAPAERLASQTAAQIDRVNTIPMGQRAYGRVKFFKAEDGVTAEQKAYRFGIWAAGALFNARWAQKKIGAMNFFPQGSEWGTLGRPTNIMGEDSDIPGGVFVPPEFETTMIDLREMFGIARIVCPPRPMSREIKYVPRRVSGLTAYAVGEGAAITASAKATNMVELIAKKFGAIAIFSSEVDEDSVINFAQDLAEEMAYAFSNKEDDSFFNGDGTSTYHGIVGARTKLTNPLNAQSLPTVTSCAGVVQGTGSGAVWTGLLLTDFQSVIGKLPQYADTPGAGWVMHKTFFETVAKRLALAAGGVTGNEIMDGVRRREFLGYPVQFSQIMPKVAVLKEVCCFLGDFSRSSKFGDRRANTLARSTDASVTDERGATVSLFTQDSIGIRMTERIAIVHHDFGNVTATASAQVPGPVVGMVAPQS